MAAPGDEGRLGKAVDMEREEVARKVKEFSSSKRLAFFDVR